MKGDVMERAVEVIEEALKWFDLDESDDMASALAKDILAALEAEGWALVRLEDASAVTLHPCCTYHDGRPMTSPSGPDVVGNGECAEFLLPAGEYRLVPVSGENPEEDE